MTGSRDTTVMVWELEWTGGSCKINRRKNRIFCGHDNEVTCVSISQDFDILVSGSKDGTCIVYSLRQGTYLRTLNLKPTGEIKLEIPKSSIHVSNEQASLISSLVTAHHPLSDIPIPLHLEISCQGNIVIYSTHQVLLFLFFYYFFFSFSYLFFLLLT